MATRAACVLDREDLFEVTRDLRRDRHRGSELLPDAPLRVRRPPVRSSPLYTSICSICRSDRCGGDDVHGLLLRLSGIDAEAEAAVSVIAAFDQLVAHRADIGALVRAAAGLAECAAGIHDPLRGVFLSVGSDGRSLPDRVIPTTSTLVKVDDGSGAEVWLDRPGGPGPLDAIVAERMAAAAAIILDRIFGSSSYAVDPGALELLLSERVSDIDRARCARLLGFAEARAIRAVAFVCRDLQRDVTTQSLAILTSHIRADGDIVQLAKVGDVFAAITTAEDLPVMSRRQFALVLAQVSTRSEPRLLGLQPGWHSASP